MSDCASPPIRSANSFVMTALSLLESNRLPGPRFSWPDSRMDADDAALHRADGHLREPGLFHVGLEGRRGREPGDRVGQVAVGRLPPGQPAADAGQDVKEVVIVNSPEQLRGGRRE